MPFIESKIVGPVSQEKKDIIVAELGEAMSQVGKPETFVMIGIEDNYDLYMGGKKMETGAFVAIRLFGELPRRSYEELTAKICQLYRRELGIAFHEIYITYHALDDWGWNGQNF